MSNGLLRRINFHEQHWRAELSAGFSLIAGVVEQVAPEQLDDLAALQEHLIERLDNHAQHLREQAKAGETNEIPLLLGHPVDGGT